MNAYTILNTIHSPEDMKKLSFIELAHLTKELRHFLIHSVLASGGHFASGLGVIELTVALHYVFNCPNDAIIWDVGHQAYPHKILTQRKDRIASIRQKGGLGPFPSIFESRYDSFGVGHSSTSISAALGMSIASEHFNRLDKQTIAVIGDGALTAGQAFEALNHAGDLKSNILVILNDNNMSISPNVGALNTMLTKTLSNPILQSARTEGAKILANLPFSSALDIAKKTEEHLKSFVVKESSIFEEFGFQYFGPVDGHDLKTLISTLENLKQKKGPKFLHIKTQKGKGYKKAEDSPVKFHAVSSTKSKAIPTDPNTPKKLTYTEVFSTWLCDTAHHDKDLMAITPAMREGSGLIEFSQRYPKRYFDAAIAEQHAVTLAAGMATQGVKPVVAIYSTFLQRAYDQLIHDVAIQNLPVTFAIDRAGIVGPDGATHAGTFDLAYLRCIPNMIVMAPSNETDCYQMLSTGFASGKPSAIRYPRGTGLGYPLIANDKTTLEIGTANLIFEGKDLLVINIGSVFSLSETIARHYNATLLDLRFVKPMDTEKITRLAISHNAIITLEDGAIMGGAGSGVAELLSENFIYTPIRHFGIPDIFPEHGERNEILDELGLNNKTILEEVEFFLKQIARQ